MNLNGKTALVTGASSGIGFGIAQALSKAGCKVIINSKSKKRIEAASKKIKNSIPIAADVTCIKQAKNLIKKVKAHTKNIDILICNVGSGSSVPTGSENHKDWQKMFNINFFSTTNIIESSRHLVTKNSGSIICISSICGIDYIPGAPATYSVAKAALNHYVKVSSREFANDGIRISGSLPVFTSVTFSSTGSVGVVSTTAPPPPQPASVIKPTNENVTKPLNRISYPLSNYTYYWYHIFKYNIL